MMHQVRRCMCEQEQLGLVCLQARELYFPKRVAPATQGWQRAEGQKQGSELTKPHGSPSEAGGTT